MSVAIKCGPGAIVEYFNDLGAVEKPWCDLCEDGNTDGACPKSSPEELNPTPDAAPDHYLNVSLVLPRGYKFDRGKVIGHKRDSEGNTIGRDNAKLVFIIGGMKFSLVMVK